MAKSLVRVDLTLPNYFTYGPAPSVATRPMIPRKAERGLFMRGEYGNQTRRRCPAHRGPQYHPTSTCPIISWNRGTTWPGCSTIGSCRWTAPAWPGLSPLGAQPDLPGAYTVGKTTYCEAISDAVLPSADELRNYEALVVLTGFGAVMAGCGDGAYNPDQDVVPSTFPI